MRTRIMSNTQKKFVWEYWWEKLKLIFIPFEQLDDLKFEKELLQRRIEELQEQMEEKENKTSKEVA